MWTKPWSFQEGFLTGGCLIIVGLALQLNIGPVVWDTFKWPVNGFVAAGFLVLITAIFLFKKNVYAFRFIGTHKAALPAIVYAIALTIIMGLTRQDTEGTWLSNMLTFWPFVLVYVYIALILGVIILNRLSRMFPTPPPTQASAAGNRRTARLFKDIAFLLNHLGLFLAMTTATLGNADMQRVRMITSIGQLEWRALEADGTVKEMPIAIELKKFIMETYDDGSPKRFASEIQIKTKTRKNLMATVDVNKPVEVDGWKIYQYGYDTQMGAQSQISILELVSDPWLPLVYTGIYMMLAGAVCMFLSGGRRKTESSTLSQS